MMRKRHRATAAGIAATLILAGAAHGQEPGSRQTREFVQAAAQSDRFEILEADTALAESKTAAVRAYAQAMIDAHQRTSADLLQAIGTAGLPPPRPGIGGDQSQFLAALQSQRDTDFDRTYIRQQILAHHAALATEQGYAATGDQPAIRQTAAAAVPIITSHLQMAEQIAAQLGGS